MDLRRPIDARATGLMTLLCLIWSLQQISLKAATPDATPMTLVALRSGVAALLLALWMRARGERPALATGRWRPGALAGGLFALEFLLVAQALRFTHAGHVVVFLYTAPIFAALGLHGRLAAERLHRPQWIGIGVAFAGIALAFLGRATGATQHGDREILLGDGLALLAGAAWGATTVVIRCSRLSSAPAAETLLYQLLCAFALLTPVALLTGQFHFAPTPRDWLNLAFHSVVVSFASFLLWFRLLRVYLASRLGVFSFMTPVFGVLAGHWLLGESVAPSFVAGGGLVLAGVLLVCVPRAATSPTPEQPTRRRERPMAPGYGAAAGAAITPPECSSSCSGGDGWANR